MVMNDLGCSRRGEGSTPSPADEIAKKINSLGGDAVAGYDDFKTFAGTRLTRDVATPDVFENMKAGKSNTAFLPCYADGGSSSFQGLD